MISDDRVEQALDFLREKAKPAAIAKAEVEYTKEWMKIVRSQEIVARQGMSVAAASAEAEASPRYQAALEAYKAAVGNDAYFRFKREAEQALIEAWRTMSSNERAARI